MCLSEAKYINGSYPQKAYTLNKDTNNKEINGGLHVRVFCESIKNVREQWNVG